MTFLDTANNGATPVTQLRSNFANAVEGQEFTEARLRASRFADQQGDVAFQEQHGISRADYELRERLRAEERVETAATADLDGDPPRTEWPGLTEKRAAYARYFTWLHSEERALADLENKRRDLESIVSAPGEAEGALRAMVRRTADLLLKGLPADASDAAKRQELEARHAAQTHRAEAARLALADLERDLERATRRVDRLREREREFLNPALHEMARPLAELLARKRAEVAALENLLDPLDRTYRPPYGIEVERPKPPTVKIEAPNWHAIATKLRAAPDADVSGLLPNVKEIA